MSLALERDRQILKVADEGGLVITSNIAQAWRLEALAEALMGDGWAGAHAGRLLPLEDFLVGCAQQSDARGRLALASLQYRALWEVLIEEDIAAAGGSILSVPGAAAKALEAYLFLGDMDEAQAPEVLFDTPDLRAFWRWRDLFQQRCGELGVADPVEVVALAIEAIGEGRVTLPERVLLYGFDGVVSGRLRKLRQALETTRVEVLDEPLALAAAHGGELVRLPCATIDEEVAQAARWAAQKVREGGLVGILTPDLQTYGGLIEQALGEQLRPGSLLLGHSDFEARDVFRPQPLARAGKVGAALLVLGAKAPMPLSTVSQLLRSPHLRGAAHEGSARAILDRETRALGQVHLSVERLVALACHGGSRGAGSAPEMAEIFAAIGEVDWSGTRRMAAWVERFGNLLALVGERDGVRDLALDRAWQEAVKMLVSLDPVLGEISRDEALVRLRRVIAEAVCQPVVSGRPVMVLGLDEAAGQGFDHLWVMGMREGIFPTPAPINTFIPVPLQKQAGTFRNEVPQARKTWARIFASSSNIVASHPVTVDECRYRPSPLLTEVAVAEETLVPADRSLLKVLAETSVDQLDGEDRVATQRGQQKGSGGVGIFRDQSLCPMRAFVHHRLQARGLDSPDVGLNHFMRGALTHYALEAFWKTHPSSELFFALEGDGYQTAVAGAAEAAVSRWEDERGERFSRRFRALETGRLRLLLFDWLDIERGRGEAFVVDQIEANHHVSIGGVEIATRLDRVDRLQSGERVLICYKTGNVSLSHWVGDRPGDPQVPIYTWAAGDEPLAAIAYAQVRRGKCRFVGVAERSGVLPGVGTLEANKRSLGEWESLPALYAHWRQALEALGESYRAGWAAPDPHLGAKPCETCDLHLFCRANRPIKATRR